MSPMTLCHNKETTLVKSLKGHINNTPLPGQTKVRPPTHPPGPW